MGMKTNVQAVEYTPSESVCTCTLLFEVFLDSTHPYSERRLGRRRPGECRAGLSKYAAARPLFALRAGRMAASGIICRGIFLGSDVDLTRAPKVPPKIVGPLRGERFLGEPAGGGGCIPTLVTLRLYGGMFWNAPRYAVRAFRGASVGLLFGDSMQRTS